ncbi:MAG TPA: hypothetical protein VMJ31_05925 [Methylocystis sp.]|nr:hypothetical protein [Methylocystis sp.]
MTIFPFGDNLSAKSSAAATAGPKQAGDFGGRFPWAYPGDVDEQESPEFLICNLALCDIRNNLRATLTIDGRVHAESYLAATGVLAGFAAQRALFDRLSSLPADRRVGQVMAATTRAGEEFFFGDMLNDALIARRDEEKRLKVWPLAFQAAISAGMNPASAPKLETLFGYVAGQISEPFYPSGNAKPGAPAKDLLTLFWPLARQAFDGELTARGLPEEELRVVSQYWRPVILGFAAADGLLEAAKIMPPARALAILMESAIYGSKVDPSALEGGGGKARRTAGDRRG